MIEGGPCEGEWQHHPPLRPPRPRRRRGDGRRGARMCPGAAARPRPIDAVIPPHLALYIENLCGRRQMEHGSTALVYGLDHGVPRVAHRIPLERDHL
jgi:hypothetical protein